MVEFQLVAEDQSKQIHHHIRALCASLCPRANRFNFPRSIEYSLPVPVHSAALPNQRQPSIYTITITLVSLRIRQLFQQVQQRRHITPSYFRFLLPNPVAIFHHLSPHPQTIALFFAPSARIMSTFSSIIAIDEAIIAALPLARLALIARIRSRVITPFLDPITHRWNVCAYYTRRRRYARALYTHLNRSILKFQRLSI